MHVKELKQSKPEDYWREVNIFCALHSRKKCFRTFETWMKTEILDNRCQKMQRTLINISIIWLSARFGEATLVNGCLLYQKFIVFAVRKLTQTRKKDRTKTLGESRTISKLISSTCTFPWHSWWWSRVQKSEVEDLAPLSKTTFELNCIHVSFTMSHYNCLHAYMK